MINAWKYPHSSHGQSLQTKTQTIRWFTARRSSSFDSDDESLAKLSQAFSSAKPSCWFWESTWSSTGLEKIFRIFRTQNLQFVVFSSNNLNKAWGWFGPAAGNMAPGSQGSTFKMPHGFTKVPEKGSGSTRFHTKVQVPKVTQFKDTKSSKWVFRFMFTFKSRQLRFWSLLSCKWSSAQPLDFRGLERLQAAKRLEVLWISFFKCWGFTFWSRLTVKKIQYRIWPLGWGGQWGSTFFTRTYGSETNCLATW